MSSFADIMFSFAGSAGGGCSSAGLGVARVAAPGGVRVRTCRCYTVRTQVHCQNASTTVRAQVQLQHCTLCLDRPQTLASPERQIQPMCRWTPLGAANTARTSNHATSDHSEQISLPSRCAVQSASANPHGQGEVSYRVATVDAHLSIQHFTLAAACVPQG